ncbi:hypothetical protein [Adlercreutzia agrestimuris]|uniref:hypothetical protein n=1 Tax=Adlercreutzia agrestimuris TaxID=2941324 RepID=UPI002040EFC3|nr:hypothetical protein [Adlercreutzia agrestimuris]
MTYYPANKRYEAKALRKMTIAFNRNTESDLLEWIESQENKAGYIKQLIREDMERQQKH